MRSLLLELYEQLAACLKWTLLLCQIVGLTVPQKADDEEETDEARSQASPALQVTTKQAALWGFPCAGAIK